MGSRPFPWPWMPNVATWSRSRFAATRTPTRYASAPPGKRMPRRPGWERRASELLPLDQWLAGLPPGFAVSGPVLEKWTAPLPEGLTMLDRQLWRPTAANVARLAHRDYLAGRRDDLWNLLPLYSRPSAAEEKWGKK